MSEGNQPILYDGESEREFLDSIEGMLRQGAADAAAHRILGLLAPLCGRGATLPARFLTVQPSDVVLEGWDKLPQHIARLAKPGKPITALSIDFSALGHSDKRFYGQSSIDPNIETNYFNDTHWPFSTADRAGLLAGYSGSSSKWQGCFVDIDDTIEVLGIGDLYGAVIGLEQHCRTPMESGKATVDECRAHLLGSSHLAVLLHRAVRDQIRRRPLPHAMAVFVGSNESYPFFDAPVVSADECSLAPAVDQPPAKLPPAAPVAANRGLFGRLFSC